MTQQIGINEFVRLYRYLRSNFLDVTGQVFVKFKIPMSISGCCLLTFLYLRYKQNFNDTTIVTINS